MTRDSPPPFYSRRRLLAALAAAWLPRSAAALEPVTGGGSRVTPLGKVVRGRELLFPRDHGSHPEFRVEWWYITGLVQSGQDVLGFQITFFRARPERQTENPSRYAPNQILIAHAALSDPRRRRLLHAQRIARAGFGLAQALEGRTAVWIDDWRLEQAGNGYRMHLPPDPFGYDFTLTRTQPPMLNGDAGYSRKGPRPESASYYYSVPHLAVSGTVVQDGRADRVTGKAWLDHEWSSSLLDERAQGWDWIGIHLDDGGALMAFRIRARDGATLWAGATLRDAAGVQRTYEPHEIAFEPVRTWQSPRTGARYPVDWRVTVGPAQYAVRTLMEDQEQDARSTTGTVYWEGAVEVLQQGRRVGAGYLELTGYWRKLTL